MSVPSLVALVSLALSTASPPGNEEEQPPCTIPSSRGPQYVRFDVRAPAVPPTRTALSFDASGGQHVEVVWDPLRSNRLDRLVILESAHDWRVSLGAEPQRDPSHGQFDYAWQFLPRDCTPFTDKEWKMPVKKLVPDCFLADAGVGTCSNLKVDEFFITFKRMDQNPTAWAVAQRLVRREGGRRSDASISSHSRSLLGAEDLFQSVNEFASIIAEVAIAHAKDRSLKLAQDRIVDFFRCGADQRFMQTCQLLKTLGLTDLAGAGQQLALAVSEDLMRMVLDDSSLMEIVSQSKAPPICPKLQWSVLSPLIRSALEPDSQREPDEVLAHRLIGTIVQGCAVPQTQNQCDPVQLSLAVLSECEQGLDCDTSSIQFYLSHAGELFRGCSSHAVPRQIFDSASFVAKGLEVLTPKADVSARRQLRIAASMLIDVLKYQAWSHSKEAELVIGLANRFGSLQPDHYHSIEALRSLFETDQTAFQATLGNLARATDDLSPGLTAQLLMALRQNPADASKSAADLSKMASDLEKLIHALFESSSQPTALRDMCTSSPIHLRRACEISRQLQSLPTNVQELVRDRKWREARDALQKSGQSDDTVSRLEDEWRKAEALLMLIKMFNGRRLPDQGEVLRQLRASLDQLNTAVSLAGNQTATSLLGLLAAINRDNLGDVCQEVSAALKQPSRAKDRIHEILGEIKELCARSSKVRLDLEHALSAWQGLREQIDQGTCKAERWDQTIDLISEVPDTLRKASSFTREDFKALCTPPSGGPRLDAVGRFIDSLLSNDFQGALLHLLNASAGGLDERQVRVVSALTSFLRTYGQTRALKPEDAAELREARKKAVLTLIDLLASREGREGQWIASLAVNPGLAASWQFAGGADMHGATLLRLNLPVGLSFDIFGGQRKNLGFHASFFVLDLGQYTEAGPKRRQVLPSPRLETALAFGAQAGLLLNSIEDPINLSFDIRYSPAAAASADSSQERLGRVSLGLTLSYLLPLIDFN